MRYFVLYKNERYSIDVHNGESVRQVKDLLRKKFDLDAKENCGNSFDFSLLLTYAGSSLEDEWILSDIAIQTGSTLRCVLQQNKKPYLRVYCSYSSETITFTEPFDVFETKVADLRAMITDKTGLHVSVFRLVTISGTEMYDCRSLKDYKVDIGDTVRMETWNGWNDFLKAATKGQITPTMKNVVSTIEDPLLAKYQLRVALFIAAHFNFTQLAAQLLKLGARSDEQIGEHPVREWCKTDSHPEHFKTPVHQAAKRGSLAVLRQFIHHNFACMLAKDAQGLTPCNLACRNKQRECFKLLVAEQFRLRNTNGLAPNIYLRVRKWSERARDRAAVMQKHSQNSILLAMESKKYKSAVVGQVVQVDGFSKNMQQSGTIINASMKAPKPVMTRQRALTGASGVDYNFLPNNKMNAKSVKSSNEKSTGFNHEKFETKGSKNKHLSATKNSSRWSQTIETFSPKQKATVIVNANNLSTAGIQSRCQVKKHNSENENETEPSCNHCVFQTDRKYYRWKGYKNKGNEQKTDLKNQRSENGLEVGVLQNKKMPEINTNQNLTVVKENKKIMEEEENHYEVSNESTNHKISTRDVFITEMFADEITRRGNASLTGKLPSLEKESLPETCKGWFSNHYFPNEKRQKSRGNALQRSRTTSCDSDGNFRYKLKKSHTIAGPGHPRRSRSLSEGMNAQSMELYRGVTGMTIPESARTSLDIATSFNKKRWLHQIRMAMDFNSNNFKRKLDEMKNMEQKHSLSDGSNLDPRSDFHSV